MQNRPPTRTWKRWLGVVVVLALLGVVLFLPIKAGVTRIVTEADIARPPADVFAYVTTPGNWPKWHPSSLAVSGAVDHPLQMGEAVVEDYLVAGRKGTVTWTVTAREPGRLWRIAGQINGHDAGVVSYSLTATPTGTHYVREFSYGAPNLMFAFLNAVSVRQQVENESAQAVRQLKAILEAGR
ncbi:SRPBCC family protein [Variovorax sp. J22R133]|uniref:SRPBCC family protein n=1 Tax=Variovorax brevis TaxID=3053503 RepID=UPI002576847F|nr:SRPBCC family protein [Variovorax sp. J22R133]MDM0115320.1 SRPBCC family protein [Variovorax sp. J22R133]